MEQSNKMYLFADKADNFVYLSRLVEVRVDPFLLKTFKPLTLHSPAFPCSVIVAATVLNCQLMEIYVTCTGTHKYFSNCHKLSHSVHWNWESLEEQQD